MVDNKFVLNIIRMTDEELLEYLVGEAEARAIYIYQNDPIEAKQYTGYNYPEIQDWITGTINIWPQWIHDYGEYDGSVFKTKEAAFNEGKIHLYELEDEGQLRGDPEDYDIDTVAIPKSEVSEYTLRFSGL